MPPLKPSELFKRLLEASGSHKKELVPDYNTFQDSVPDILTLEEFARSLRPGGKPCERVVVCLVHADDVNESDEPFYLARIVSKARVISDDCLVGGNEYNKGDLVVNIKWYVYINSSRGDRIYRLQSGNSKGIPYSVGSIVRNVDGIKFKSYDKGKYILDRETSNRLTRWLSNQ